MKLTGTEKDPAFSLAHAYGLPASHNGPRVTYIRFA
jgi:hypothetical protein